MYGLHLQGGRVSEAKNSKKQVTGKPFCWFIAWLFYWVILDFGHVVTQIRDL
jgi:hypothetical protein